MINAIEKNLNRGIALLHSLTNEQYSCKSTPPYHSSIGNHIRHVLDVFSCVFNGLDAGIIDLTERKRDKQAEENTTAGIVYFEDIKSKLKNLNKEDLENEVLVIDDLGLGKEKVKYTLASILMQAQSHAIHHYASIGYLLYAQGIELYDNDFGYNPTTPKKAS